MTITAEQAHTFGVEQLQRVTAQDGRVTLPQNGIVVVYMSTCPHCQHSLENTNMAIKAGKNTAVTWIDIATTEGENAFKAIPGAEITKGGDFMINGIAIAGVPTTVGMRNGVASEVLKTGVLERSDLDMLAAIEQSKCPSARTGKSIPYNAPPQVVNAQGR